MKEEAILNFLRKMDKRLSINEHINNAHLDARHYGWDKKTLNELLTRIIKEYRRKQDD